MQAYNIKIQHFEGPFDLLLFFIERDELDINDIPIAEITQEFLEYIKIVEAIDIDLASEFILVAATLMRIKAKMLIPRKELDAEGNEIDPRHELTQKLLEYRKYASIVDEMSALEDVRNVKHHRGNISHELKQIAEKALVDIEMESLSLFKLLKTFQYLIEKQDRFLKTPKHQIVKFDYTVEEQQSYILDLVSHGKKINFNDIFVSLKSRVHAIVTFIALLELLNLQQLSLLQGEGTNNFWVEAVM